ncbi:MAG TPA: hypothetical protein EYP55_09670 [Anaerolineae bacterium]|nr:hypothetical protein [Anaerolineae bacterium]
MKETILDKPVASVTLRELIETFREVIRQERQYHIDDEGYLVFSSERAYAEYLDKQKGKLPSEVQAYFIDEQGLKVVYSDYEPTPEKARELAETRNRIAEGRAKLYSLEEVGQELGLEE